MKPITCFCLILLAAFSLAGQTPPPAQTPPTASPQREEPLRVNVDLVDVLFTVSDKKGKLITNLKQSDFKVYEDDRLHSINRFTAETNLPLTIALLIDTSGSIRDKLRFEQEAAIDFFYSTLNRGRDRGLLITFDSGVDLIQDFTDDPEVLAEGVRKIRAGGGTSLYDAMFLAVEQKLANQPGRKVMIVISDGDDNSSRLSLTETLDLAQKNDVAIYTVSTNAAAYFGRAEQERGDKTLRRFADETGGKAFSPFKLSELAVSFQDIHEELRSQYRLAYIPVNKSRDGQFRRIRIEPANKNSNYSVKSRSGYYAPRGGTSPE